MKKFNEILKGIEVYSTAKREAIKNCSYNNFEDVFEKISDTLTEIENLKSTTKNLASFIKFDNDGTIIDTILYKELESNLLYNFGIDLKINQFFKEYQTAMDTRKTARGTEIEIKTVHYKKQIATEQQYREWVDKRIDDAMFKRSYFIKKIEIGKKSIKCSNANFYDEYSKKPQEYKILNFVRECYTMYYNEPQTELNLIIKDNNIISNNIVIATFEVQKNGKLVINND